MGLRKGNQKGYLLNSEGKLDPKAVEIYRYRLKHPGYFIQNVIFLVVFFGITLLVFCAMFALLGVWGIVSLVAAILIFILIIVP